MNKSESKYFNTALLMDEAFLYLLEKKDFEYITVKEICKKAGVNRSTFYLHYETLNDLLAETIGMLNDKFVKSFRDIRTVYDDIRSDDLSAAVLLRPEYLVPYLEFIRDNKRVYKTIHEKPGVFNVSKAFDKMYGEIFAPTLRRFCVPKEEEKYIFEFFTQGVLSVIMKWVSLDCADTVEFMTSVIMKCVEENIRKVTDGES